MNYPRVLIVTMGRINDADTDNNSLLLRNIFAKWPRQNLAQIYSSGDNSDYGFFDRYYQLSPRDRLFGRLFYGLKTKLFKMNAMYSNTPFIETNVRSKTKSTKEILTNIFVDTGLYELIFRPRLSREMISWVQEFQPDIIFAQGYCLTFAWLPSRLSDYFKLPIVYYPTDDWPNDAYRVKGGGIPIVSKLVSRSVARAARHLVEVSSVLLAFNRYMREEYLKRYNKEFVVLMHGDDLSRYQTAQPMRLAVNDEYWIVCTGLFGNSRFPLLYDLDQACKILNAKGLRVRATVFPVNEVSEISSQVNGFIHVDFEPCPSHSALVSVLKGADILFLPERFDESAQGISLSVSSKAHLFMFSGKPIVVYSDSVTGIARYAKEEGWAVVLDYRDPVMLSSIFERLIKNSDARDNLLKAANRTALANHDLKTIQSSFTALLNSAIPTKDGNQVTA